MSNSMSTIPLTGRIIILSGCRTLTKKAVELHQTRGYSSMRPENYQVVALPNSDEYELFIGPNHPGIEGNYALS